MIAIYADNTLLCLKSDQPPDSLQKIELTSELKSNFIDVVESCDKLPLMLERFNMPRLINEIATFYP